MLKKLATVLLSCLMLSYGTVAWAAGNNEVTTITRTQKKVAVECPKVVSGNNAVNTKINTRIEQSSGKLCYRGFFFRRRQSSL
jgi:hypothetical protein